MQRIPIKKIEPGMILARSIQIPSEPHQVLLDQGQQISFDLATKLEEKGVHEVWIQSRETDILDEMIAGEFAEESHDLFSRVREKFEVIMCSAPGDIAKKTFLAVLAALFDYLKQDTISYSLLKKIADFDDDLLRHCVNVCYRSLLLGFKIKDNIECEGRSEICQKKDILELALGCLLHDVGKTKIPLEILYKPGKLTSSEMEEMKLHTVYGYEMVKGEIPNRSADILLCHHRYFNGTGYPDWQDGTIGRTTGPPSGKDIPLFSRIATLCDVYDAATSRRCYSEAKPSVQVLHEMRTQCAGFFDPVIEKAFYQIIPAFPLGQIVTLSNGLGAVVVDFNPQHPVRPKVQYTIDQTEDFLPCQSYVEIDLVENLDLEIVEAEGVDVRPFLTSQETNPTHSIA